MIFKKDELKLLWPFYVASFSLTALLIFMAYWVVYFKEFLTFTQLSTLIALFMISPALFEVPTGVIADVFGRKISTLMGYFFPGILFISIGFTNSYPVLALLFLLLGFTSTMASGAENAWVVDRLIQNKKENLKKEFFQKTSIIRNLAIIVSSITGILIVKFFPFNYIWFLSGSGFILSSLMLFFIDEKFERKKGGLKESYKEFIIATKQGFKYTFSHKKLLILLIGLIIFYYFGSLSHVSWEPELVNIGLPVHLLGFGFIITALFGLLISFNYHRVIQRFGHAMSLNIGIVIMSLIYITAYFIFNPYIMLILFAVQISISNSYFYPIQMDYFHEFYTSKIRATLESITSMLFSIGVALFVVLGGFLNDLLGPRIVILVSGILILPAIIPLLKLKKSS